ncbi:MAG: L,D-transpeptidase [Verrucomicrobiaceae bacterium]|nr:L,D-transpeptidase [Verrucomicrobiaceae bacterium]
MMIRCFLLILSAITLTACQTPPPPVAPQPLLPRWKAAPELETCQGPVRVDVSLATSTAQLLAEDGTVLAEMDVSPGVEGHRTPMGRFRVTEKLPLKRSNLYGQYVKKGTQEVVVARTWEHVGPRPEGTEYLGIAMPWWMRLTADGVGMHVGGFERGKPTSHGCIRCPEDGQRLFYEKSRIGTPVHVHDGEHEAPSLLELPAEVLP